MRCPAVRCHRAAGGLNGIVFANKGIEAGEQRICNVKCGITANSTHNYRGKDNHDAPETILFETERCAHFEHHRFGK
jgi:hypothetical protein